ncbi:MAG: outer membrane beta-barrel protein [Vicinamibacterales bacterium]
MIKRSLVILLYALSFSQAAHAQQAPADDPVASAPIHLGVVGVSPRFVLSNAGIDTNVFNTVDDRQRDFTFTTAPSADLYLRTGRGLLSVSGGAEFVYFQKFDTERSVNSNATGRYEFRFNRVRPYASAGTLNTKQRPGHEIDVRARHYETDLKFGSDVMFMSKSSARLEFRKLDYKFAGDAVFDGRPLNQGLNRTLKAVDLGWRQRLTALTTWVTRVSRESERFEFEDARNSDSFRVSSGFELGRFALIRGSAFAGFRKLTAADGGTLPGFSGVTADVDVSYTAPTQTRLGAAVDRDIQYSYDNRTPYYVQTGWTATLTQRVTGKWDAQLSGGRDRLAYQSNNAADRRKDFVGRFAGGIGYAVRDGVRASFDVQSFYRSSAIRGREYGGVRAGFSMTYGY